MGLLSDFLQGASNSAASNISAPVDGIAWLLRKAGIDTGTPVMGSDWMAQKGFTAQPQNQNAGLLGEAIGGVAPLLAAAKAPQIAKGLLAIDDKAMDMGRKAVENRMVSSGMIQPATVWHGSPHKFDKFDASKIGTGEGAQAYGHGLYLAESPDVAGQYQKTLAADGFLVGDKVFDPSSLQHMNVRTVARKGDIDAAISKASELANSGSPVANLAAQDLARLQQIKAAGGLQPNTGALYKVDLPDEHIAKMLDWDKPLSQQPNIRGMIPKELEDVLSTSKDMPWTYGKKADDMTGQDLIRSMAALKGTYAGASDVIKDAGIPGIRYLDGGSRGAGAGSSNFVIFPGNEGLLQILERNGQAVK